MPHMTLAQLAAKHGVTQHLIMEPSFQRVQGPRGYIWFARSRSGLVCCLNERWKEGAMPVRAEWHAAKHDWSISHKQALHLIGLKSQLGWDKAQGVRVRRRLHQDLEESTNNKQQAETTPEKERSDA